MKFVGDGAKKVRDRVGKGLLQGRLIVVYRLPRSQVRRLFSPIVTASRWLGLTHSRVSQVWSR